MKSKRPRSLRGRLASAAILVLGVLALIAMGPQFIVFIPIVIAAWLLARFGLVPRAVHPRDSAIRIGGGPEAGALRFADVHIHAQAGRARATAGLVLDLARTISDHAGAEPEVDGDPATLFASLVSAPERLIDPAAPRIALVWSPGDTAPARVDASAASERWAETWPRAVAAQSARRAQITLEARWEPGSDDAVIVGLLGDPSLLGAALADVARQGRESADTSAWTSGWVRDVERELARADAARRRRAKARAS